MKLKFLRGMAVVAVLSVGSLSAQHVDLNRVLYRSVTERVQLPLVFSTRDSLFALSLPTADEGPAEVYVQLTVGRNGRVKEKKTRVSANHVGVYVAPAFTAAAKGLQIDRDSVPALAGRDTSVVLTFPLEYRCVLDTMTRAWPNAGEELQKMLREINTNTYPSMLRSNGIRPMTLEEIDFAGRQATSFVISHAKWEYKQLEPTRIWYYLIFLGDSKY
ncbi:hypothetical protein [uncultured Rikenella sp.]|uniref:hypothetical protein n=1 Tax=uncultured Rikenella sp. TaxID=368003 RepID=UPI0025D06081|nr:hypothetical protein [uncultured Rikenella sp.]